MHLCHINNYINESNSSSLQAVYILLSSLQDLNILVGNLNVNHSPPSVMNTHINNADPGLKLQCQLKNQRISTGDLSIKLVKYNNVLAVVSQISYIIWLMMTCPCSWCIVTVARDINWCLGWYWQESNWTYWLLYQICFITV